MLGQLYRSKEGAAAGERGLFARGSEAAKGGSIRNSTKMKAFIEQKPSLNKSRRGRSTTLSRQQLSTVSYLVQYVRPRVLGVSMWLLAEKVFPKMVFVAEKVLPKMVFVAENALPNLGAGLPTVPILGSTADKLKEDMMEELIKRIKGIFGA
jgi:hypothetical protein